MPIHLIDTDTPGIYYMEVAENKGVVVQHTSLDGWPDDKVAASADLVTRLQNFLDYVVAVDDILATHPDDERALNAPTPQSMEYGVPVPITNRAWYVKLGPPPNVYIVERSVLVVGAVWDESIENFSVTYQKVKL